MQGLQKCWARREVKQPPSPEPSFGLSLCCSPRQHQHSPAKSKQDSAAVPSDEHHLPHDPGRGAVLLTKRFLMLFGSAPASLILLHHHQELKPTLWEMPANPLLPGMMETMHWKTVSREGIPCLQVLSSPVFRHGETLCTALFTSRSQLSQICCVPFKSQLYQVLTISSFSPCPPFFCMPSVVCVAVLWNKFGDASAFSILKSSSLSQLTEWTQVVTTQLATQWAAAQSIPGEQRYLAPKLLLKTA